MAGIALGSLGLALTSLVRYLSPSMHPLWASFQNFGTSMPSAGTVLDLTLGYVTTAALGLIILKAINNLTQQKKIGTPLLTGLFVLMGLAITGIQIPSTVLSWLLAGTVQGIFLFLAYWFVLRTNPIVILPATAIFSIGTLIQQAAFNAYPFATLAYTVTCVTIVITCALLLTKTSDT